MPVQSARAADEIGAQTLRWVVARRVTLTIATLALSGCAASAPDMPRVADPKVAVPAARYSSVTAPYVAKRPVGPLPWREQNERVAPRAQP